MLLLDTCTLLWLAADQDKLPERVKEKIAQNKTNLFVSAITAFEIAIKEKKKKLKLPIPANEWYIQTLNSHGINEIPITGDIASASAMLPPKHKDPCDRIIIATAKTHNCTILTCDKLISQYPKIKTIW